MEKGVLLIAYGGMNYAQMAYNMVLSLRHYSPKVKVAVVHDGCMNKLNESRPDWKTYFDHIDIFIPKSAGENKVCLDKLTPFKHTLYLDVDGIIVKDITPLLDGCIKHTSPLLCQVHGKGGVNDSINYAIWAKNVSAWAWFDIPIDGFFQATQTSIVYFSDKAGYLFDMMREKFNFPKKYFTHHWGNSVPDELIFSGVAAHHQLDIDMKAVTDKNPVFFANSVNRSVMLRQIEKNNYVLGFCGAARQLRKKYLSYGNVFLSKMKGQPFDVIKVFNRKFAG